MTAAQIGHDVLRRDLAIMSASRFSIAGAMLELFAALSAQSGKTRPPKEPL